MTKDSSRDREASKIGASSLNLFHPQWAERAEERSLLGASSAGTALPATLEASIEQIHSCVWMPQLGECLLKDIRSQSSTVPSACRVGDWLRFGAVVSPARVASPHALIYELGEQLCRALLSLNSFEAHKFLRISSVSYSPLIQVEFSPGQELEGFVECIDLEQFTAGLQYKVRFSVADPVRVIAKGDVTCLVLDEKQVDQRISDLQQVDWRSRRRPAILLNDSSHRDLNDFHSMEPIRYDRQDACVRAYQKVSEQWPFFERYPEDPQISASYWIESWCQMARPLAGKVWPTPTRLTLAPESKFKLITHAEVRPYHDEVCLELHLRDCNFDRGLICDGFLFLDNSLFAELSGLEFTAETV